VKYTIPIDVQIDLGDGVSFGGECAAETMVKQLQTDIIDALCCRAGTTVEEDLANKENHASRYWGLVELNWGMRGEFSNDP
jgi:hypothetical protein